MRDAQCFAVYEMYSCIDVCMCICLYIVERALYMCVVHDVANLLLVANNIISRTVASILLTLRTSFANHMSMED